MAEPPIPATGHGDAPASFNAVFIDTSLDTHLAVIVSSSETVADLKKKILDEHPLCFPKFKEIKIDGLKVKRRGFYYHLAESMLVRNAFDGIKKDWFVSVEASIASTDKEIEPEAADLALGLMNSGVEEVGANVVLDGRLDVTPERDLLVSQKDSNEILVQVAGGVELACGDDCGDKVLSVVPFVSDESHRDAKSDEEEEEEAQEMEVERSEIGKEFSSVDANNILPDGVSDVKEKLKKRKRSKQGYADLSGKDTNAPMHELRAKGGEEEIKVRESTALDERSELVVGDVHISDQNVAGVQTEERIALPEESEALVENVEFAKDGSKGYVVNKQNDNPFEENLDDLPEANKKRKTGKEMEDEASLRESRTTVSESNEMTCEPPDLSQIPTLDEQQLVAASQEVPKVDTLEAVDRLASQSSGKKKKKKKQKKSSKKVDNGTAGVTPEEAKAGEEIHLKEAGINSGNVAEELPPSDAHMIHPSAVSLTEKDPDPLHEQPNNLLSQDINEFQKPVTNEINTVETEREVAAAVSTIVHKEAVDYVVNKQNDNPFEENLDHLPVANKKHKTGKERDDEASLRESRTVVSESNEMTCEPSDLSQLPTTDERQLVAASQEGPKLDTLEALDRLTSQTSGKKKKKKKSSKKVDNGTAGVTPDEPNAGEEMHLEEAGVNSGNIAEEQPPSDAHVLQPSAVSLTEKDPDPPHEQANNLLSQDINEFQKPVTKEINTVETEREVAVTVSTIVHEEAVDSILPEVYPSVDHGKASKKKRKSKKQKQLTVPALSDTDNVRDYSTTDIPSDEPEKVGKAENSIHEAAGKGDVKKAAPADEPEKVGKAENSIHEAAGKVDVKKAAPADSLRASLLVTDKEIDDVIKNVVESAQQTTNREGVAENKEGKSRKKTKKHGSDGVNFGSDFIPGEQNKNTADPSEVTDEVSFNSYGIHSERNKKIADPTEVTGDWTKTKGKKKRKVQEGNLHDISSKLPGSPTLKEKLEAHTKPREKKAEPSSGKADKQKPHCEEAQESKAVTRSNAGKSKTGIVIEHHHSESLTNSTSHTRRGKKDPSQSQQNSVNGGKGSNGNQGKDVNDTVRPKSVVARSLFKSNPFGDDSDDSLESYHFPSPLQQQPRANSQDTYSNLSESAVHSDGESDAGFESVERYTINVRKGMNTTFSSETPLDTILKSSKRYKKAKLDAESQPEDFVPSSPSI